MKKDLKVNTLSGRWIDGKTKKRGSIASGDSDTFYIERHSVFYHCTKLGRGKDSPMIAHKYSVVTVFDKMAATWFIRGKPKA